MSTPLDDLRARPVELNEVAYYHEPYWGPGDGDWLKTLLLFFDGVALLVPDYMRDRPLATDPTLAEPLADRGLLHRLSPESLVDRSTAEALTDLLDALLTGGALDQLDRGTPFAELSYSRLGAYGDAGLAELLVSELQDRGLAKPSEDGVSVPLHPVVRSLILVALPPTTARSRRGRRIRAAAMQWPHATPSRTPRPP